MSLTEILFTIEIKLFNTRLLDSREIWSGTNNGSAALLYAEKNIFEDFLLYKERLFTQ